MPLRTRVDEAQLRITSEQRAKGDLPLQPGQGGPETVVDALTERQVRVVGSPQIQPVRVRKLAAEVRAATGRPPGLAVVASVMVATGPGAEDRMAAERRDWNIAPDVDCTVVGDADQVAAGLRRWVEAGVTRLAIQPTASEPDLPALIRFLARDVAPRLQSLSS